MNNQDKSPERSKKPYRRPRLRAVELVAEEVLGIGCKDGSGSAAGQPCISDLCILQGS